MDSALFSLQLCVIPRKPSCHLSPHVVLRLQCFPGGICSCTPRCICYLLTVKSTRRVMQQSPLCSQLITADGFMVISEAFFTYSQFSTISLLLISLINFLFFCFSFLVICKWRMFFSLSFFSCFLLYIIDVIYVFIHLIMSVFVWSVFVFNCMFVSRWWEKSACKDVKSQW